DCSYEIDLALGSKVIGKAPARRQAQWRVKYLCIALERRNNHIVERDKDDQRIGDGASVRRSKKDPVASGERPVIFGESELPECHRRRALIVSAGADAYPNHA